MLIRLLGMRAAAVASVWMCTSLATAQTIIPWPRPAPPPPRIDPPPRHPIRPPRPPRPPIRDARLEVKKQSVDVSIIDGTAVTRIDQVFVNPYAHPVEGTYVFPLADDVALSNFSMFIDGREIQGELLGVEEARRTYESIVSRMRDPALLEYVGTRMFRARIFPIPPKGEARVRLSYSQMLSIDNGLARYTYPLGVDRHFASRVGSLSLVVNVESTVPVKSVFSSTHKVSIHRESDYKASASFERTNYVPDKDFELYYALSDKEFGLTVLTFRESGDDGFFLARIAPLASSASADILAKDVAFVIDTSGSMAGEKMRQAREALKFCLSSLHSRDRFNVIPFSHEPVRFRDGLVPASPENVEEARRFTESLAGSGGTNINDALLTALAAAPHGDAERPYLIVFLTDGLPTVGVTDIEAILSNVQAKNANRVRLFAFGLGDDVNTRLIDLLAERNRGARDYVAQHEDLELKLSSFYRKVSNPVLADLALAFNGLTVTDMYPPKPGDLFAGSELVVVGRYKGEGAKAVELSGTRRGQRERHVYETTFPAISEKHAFLPRLWATRKIGFLLDEIRLHGENKELKDSVVKLAMRYGIVTPYTAYLVTEPGSIARRGGRGPMPVWEGRAWPVPVGDGRFHPSAGAAHTAVPLNGVRRSARAGKMKRRASGAQAVYESTSALQLRDAESEADLAPDTLFDMGVVERSDRPAQTVRRVGTRTFYWVDGRWLDAAYDKDAQGTETTKVELFSDAYFKLIRKKPELAKCFALGKRVIVVLDGTAYETVPPTEE